MWVMAVTIQEKCQICCLQSLPLHFLIPAVAHQLLHY